MINTFGKDHLVLNGTVGDGTGRYAQDLGSASAAVVDANGDVQPLLTFGGFLGYRHFWAEDLRSQVTYGYLRLEDRSELSVDAYRSTHYAQANFVWSPDPRFNIGAEYLFGHKRTRDGATGQDHRVQLSAKFGLF